MVPNIRVERFPNPEELRLCRSELDVPSEGWAVVIPETAAREVTPNGMPPDQTEVLPGGGWSMEIAEHGRCEVFHDGEFVGDARTVEVTNADGRPFAELLWAPVPSNE